MFDSVVVFILLLLLTSIYNIEVDTYDAYQENLKV